MPELNEFTAFTAHGDFLRDTVERRANRLRYAIRPKKRAEGKMLRDVLDDSLKWKAFEDKARRRYAAYCEQCMADPSSDMSKSDGMYGSLQDFFAWILENWPAILEMIKSIIDLFTHANMDLFSGAEPDDELNDSESPDLGFVEGGVPEPHIFSSEVRRARAEDDGPSMDLDDDFDDDDWDDETPVKPVKKVAKVVKKAQKKKPKKRARSAR